MANANCFDLPVACREAILKQVKQEDEAVPAACAPRDLPGSEAELGSSQLEVR